MSLGSLVTSCDPYETLHTSADQSLVPLQYAHEMERLTCPRKEATLNKVHLSN